ncbi:MAG: CcdC protein domain-containing protein [Sphingomonas sp.]
MSFVIPLVIIGVVLAIRLPRMVKERPLKLEQLWVVPGIFLLVAALVFYGTPPKTPIAWGISGVALLVGAVLGWQRGSLMRITVDPQTHSLSQKASPAAILFLLLLIVVRTGAREVAIFNGPAMHFDVNVVTDALLALALGLLSVTRLEMYLRARRMLEEARSA